MRGRTDEKEKCLEKLNEMQIFLPFLDCMIDKIKKKHVLPLECQLSKFQYIRSLIIEKNGRYSLEGLTNIEDVLQKLIIKLDYKGLILKDIKEPPGVKVKSTSSTEVLAKTDYESTDLPNYSVSTTTNSKSNAFTSNINDSPGGTVDILVKSLRMSVGHSSQSDDINSSNPVCCDGSSAIECTEKFGIAESECADKKELGDSKKDTEQISKEVVGSLKNSTASDVLAISRKKLLNSVSGKALVTDNNNESDLRSVVRPDFSKNIGSVVPECKRTNCNPTYNDKREKRHSSKNDSLNNELSDISDEEYIIEEKSRSNGKDKNAINSVIIKRRKISTDNYRTNEDSVNRADFKSNDNFVIGTQSSSVFEFSNKQKLRERLSADIAEVHKVPGKSIGGSLRSLKDVKTSSQENESVKPDKTTESYLCDLKKISSKEKNDHRRSSHENKYGHSKKDSKFEDLKSGRKESGHHSSRDKWKHGKYGSDLKNKSDTSYSSAKSSSISNGSKEKKGKEKRESEIDKLNDHELAAFVRENISSFPNLSKLRPEELRRVARSSLLGEDLNFEGKSGLEAEENSGEKTFLDQDLSKKSVIREKSDNGSSHCSPPRIADRMSEVNADSNSLQVAFVKDNGKLLSNTEVRPQFEYSKTLMEESVYSSGIVLSSTQLESGGNLPLPEFHIHEDFNALDPRDQRLKHSLPITPDTRSLVNDTRIPNWMQKPEANPPETFIPARFSNLYNDRNICDLRTRAINVSYENPYFNRPYFPVQGNNRFQSFESGPYDTNNSTQRHYTTVEEAVRFSGYNFGRNSNFNMPEPKSYGEYKQLKRQEQEIMNRYRVTYPDLPVEPTTSEEEFPENKSKLSISFFGSKTVEDGKGKDSSKSLAAKGNDYNKGTKVNGSKTSTGKSDSKFRKSSEGEKGAKKDKSSESKKPSVEDELISPLEKLYDNDPKLVTGRGYGLQNFKIPKKGKSEFGKSQKTQPHDKGPKTKERLFCQDKFDTETNFSKAGLEDENKLVNKNSDRSMSKLKPEIKIVPEFHSAANKVIYEEYAKKSNLSKKKSVTDDNDSDRHKKDNGKSKIAFIEQQNGVLETLTREELINNNPQNSVEPASSEGSLLQSNDFNERIIEHEVSPEFSQLKKPPVTYANLESFSENTNGNKDGNATILESLDSVAKVRKDVDVTNKTSITEEITQELVEALIRKSFESGEGELLLAKAKLFKELALKLNSKKLKTIQKIINSESDSSCSSSDTSIISERKKKKKKKDSNKAEKSSKKTKKTKKRAAKSRKYTDSSGDDMNKEPELSDGNINSDKNDLEVENIKAEEAEILNKNSKTSKRKSKLLQQIFNKSPSQAINVGENTTQTSRDKEPDQKAKVKGKSKGKTELDRLHEDIRSMFIASGVVTATGQRMCRILRESGGKMNNLDLVKESAKMVEEEKLASRKTGKRSVAQAKGSKNKSAEQRTRRERSKTGKQVKVDNARISSYEIPKNLEFDDMKLWNVVRDQPRVMLQRINLKKLCYAYKIGGFPESYTRKRGMNVAKRGRFARSMTRSERENEIFLTREGKVYLLRNIRKYYAMKNTTAKKVYKPKKLSDVIQNLRTEKFGHLDFSGKNTSKEDKVRHISNPDADANSKQNILKHNEILKYAFDRTTSVFFCLLCNHSTKAITEHYVLKHPDSEVLISRLAISEAEKAIRDSEVNNYSVVASNRGETVDILNGVMKSKLSGTPSYFCRMCNHGDTTIMSQFFSHVSTHTGEYRFQCPVEGCSLPIANRENVKIHVTWKHPKNKHQANKPIELFPLPTDSEIMFGYLCSYCNFVQLLRKNVETHILKKHAGIEGVKIIKIDMSRQKEKKSKTGRTNQKKIHDDNEVITDIELSVQNEDSGNKLLVGNEEIVCDSYEIVTSNNNESNEDSCSSPSESLDKETEDYRSSTSGRSESETQNIGLEILENDEGTKSNDGCSVDSEKVIIDGTTGVDIFDSTMSNCVGYELNVAIDEMEQVNCFDIMQTDEDMAVANELVEEVVLSMDTSEGTDIMITDEVTNSAIEKCWEVGPLKAILFETTIILYVCTETNCQFSTKLFDDLEKHISTAHSSETWTRACKSCVRFPDRKVEGLGETADIHQILEHLVSHIKMDAGEDAIKKIKSEEIIIDENQEVEELEAEGQETEEQDEMESVTIETLEDEPYPMKPLLRVRSFTGDRLSKPKYVSDEDHSYSESPTAVNRTFQDAGKNATEPLFMIKDVRSLNPESKGNTSSNSTVYTSQNFTVKKFPPNAEVVSGKPVLVRSCPSPKITIRPETNAVSIPVAQAKQGVEAGHLKVVSPRADSGSTVGKKLETSPKSSIRIVSPGTLTTKKVIPPILTTSTRLVPISKPIDAVMMPSKNKSQTLNPVVKKISPGPGLCMKDVKISNTDKESNNMKKKNSEAPPLISISKPSKPSGGSTRPKVQVPQRSPNSYPISFGGKNMKDIKIYQEMLTKKKLCQLFKCMAVECSFSCNSDAIFTQHIGLHEAQQRIRGKKRPQSKIKKIYNWQQCAYCCEVLVHTGSALSQHILAEHGHCLYQCAYCFYRAVSEIYVDIHQKTVHDKLLKEKKKVMYKCQPVPGASMSKQFEKQIRPHNVRPYQCEICGYKFFIIKHFLEHLTRQHVAVTAYACHICKILCFKPDRLIAHYKLHSYSLFQCSYCLHGTETQKEMLLHLCNFHFSQPPILYARMIEDVSNGNNVIFDDLKLINLENEPCDSNCVIEEVETEEHDAECEDIRSLPISVDLSSIVSELGINIEDGTKSKARPLGKVMMDMETDFSRLMPVETILPNAKFSSDSDNLCEDNSSVLISSECIARHSKKEEKQVNVPIGQLPVEVLTLESKNESAATKIQSELDHMASIEKGIEKLQQNNCQVIISTVPDKKSVDEMPTRSMHKLPPTIPINRSGVNNIFQAKKNVTKKLENIPGQVKEGVPALIKRFGTSQRISSNCMPQKSLLLTYSAADDKLTQKKKDTTRIPSVQTVMSVKRQGSELEGSVNKISESNPAKRLRLSSGPHSSLTARNSAREGPLMISNIRSLSAEKTILQPPIIRVEDFANDEKGKLVRKKEHLSMEIRNDSRDCDKGGNSVNEDSDYYPEAPLSPDVIIIDIDNCDSNLHREILKVVDSAEAVQRDESNKKEKGKEKKKLERAENNDNDHDDNDEDDNEEEGNDEEEEDDEGEHDDNKDDDDDDEDDIEEEEEAEEEDIEIMKQMENLRNQIENETDCLLIHVTAPEDNPLACSEKSEGSKACFSTDGETIQSFNKDSQPTNVESGETKDEPPQKNVTEIADKVTEVNENEKKETNSGESKEDEQAVETQNRLGNRGRTNQIQKKPKANTQKAKELSGKDLYLCGIMKCNFAADNYKELKDHLCVCDLSRDSSVLSCPHCSRQFKHTMSYIDHLKIHGEKKYSCGLCNFCSTTESNVNRHLKQKHKCSQTKTLPNDSFKPGYFAVYPKNYKVEKQNEVTNVYSPGDEDKLPLQSIYQENVKCSQCPYFTKVRSNMVRHLKIHIKSAETEGSIVVPKTAPTNPVPCLDAKERMFDKMANLAASSQLAHANKEKKDTIPPEEKAKLPQFVPEQMRYKCCSPDCNYLTVDDNMLKHHIKALHDEINIYSCPHCTESVNVEYRFAPLDKIGQHLKYHDSKLYKCCHCLYFHYQKYVVEKHMLEKHPERRFYVYTIREPKAESASEEEHPSTVESVVKLWKCGFCDDFERPTRSDVADHLFKVHNMKSKFKCKYCDMKSSQYSSFVSHFASKHHGLKVECVRSIMQVNRTCSGGSHTTASQDSSTKYFDTTPLWQRDAPRVRHIRGILIEEEEVKKKRTKKVGSNAENESASTFPLDSFYCPLCADKKKFFTTKNSEMFRNHLYQELNYQQYACTLCGKMFIDKKEYERHHLRSHPNKNPGFKQTKEDSEIKFWVEKVVLKQETQLKERKRRISSEEGAAQSPKKKKLLLDGVKATTKEKTETVSSQPETSCLYSKMESKLRSKVTTEKSDFIRLTRSGSGVQGEPAVGKRPDSKSERSEQKSYGKQELKWLCHYCKDLFLTEDEVVAHCKSNHADRPIKTMLVQEEDTVEPIDDLWLIEYSREGDSDSDDSGDGTVKKTTRRGSMYSCGYCMIEVTDQTSIVNHFETYHKSSHSMARVGMVGTIYYRCNVCLEKLLSFSSLNVHAKEHHPNMTLQFEIRKIYKYDTKAKDSEAAKAALEKAADGSYQCPRCPTITSSYLDCIDHFNEHYPRYTCGNCNIRYYTVEEMEIHQSECFHSIPYAMTIPSEKMLDEYKAGITVKKNGVWLPLQENRRTEVRNEAPDTRRVRVSSTARKSTTQVPERRSGDEASTSTPRSMPPH